MKRISLIYFWMFIASLTSLYAIEPGVWTIIRPDGIYAGGKIQIDNPLNGKVLSDIAITGKDELVLITKDNVFYVTDESSKTINIGSPIKLKKSMLDGDSKKIPYSTTTVRPRIQTQGEAGFLAMVSGMVFTTDDGQSFDYLNTLKSGEKVSQSDMMFTEFEDIYANRFGWAIAGGLKMTVNSGIAEMDELYKYFGNNARSVLYGIRTFLPDGDDTGEMINAFLTKEEVEKSKETSSFRLTGIVVDKNHTVWALGGNSKTHLWKVSAGKTRYVMSDVNAITIDAQGNAVIATETSIMTIDANNNTHVLLEQGASHITFDQAGILWYQPPIKKTSVSAKSDVISLSELRNLKQTAQDRKNEQQAQTENPQDALLVRYDPATGANFLFTVDNSPIKGNIYKIVSDSKNYKYILAGVDDKQLGIYIIKEPESKIGEWAVMNDLFNKKDVADHYWRVSCNGSDGKFAGLNFPDSKQISLFDGKMWKREDFELDKTGLLFTFLSASYMNNVLYVGTSDYLYTLENGKMSQLNTLNQKSVHKMINALTVDHSNRLWIGSGDGLAVYDGETYTYFNKKTDKGLPDVAILSLCSSGDNVFVGATDGLSVYDGNTWKFYDSKTGLKNKRVPSIAANSKGQVFIASVTVFTVTDVLNIYQNGELTSESLPQKISINKMLFDEQDNLWIMSPTGLICRKANGEYVIYELDGKSFPVNSSCQNIVNISVVDGDVWLSVREMSNRSTTTPQGFEAEIIGKLSTFGGQQVIVRKKNQ